jgi:hypothetical protein
MNCERACGHASGRERVSASRTRGIGVTVGTPHESHGACGHASGRERVSAVRTQGISEWGWGPTRE